MMLEYVLSKYGLSSDSRITTVGNGLINNTWIVTDKDETYILQKINDQVFKSPQSIDTNITNISDYLSRHYPDYIFTSPVKNLQGQTLLYTPDKAYYRIFNFVKNSHSYNVVSSVKQAFEAASAFAEFTCLLSDFDVSKLKITLENFHDLLLRFRQFEKSLLTGNEERIHEAENLIKQLISYRSIADEYALIINSTDFKIRVTHHDTKISNVLFNDDDQSICVIDLDTVMPGYFISDLGDMMRTYLSPVSEEENDLNKIEIREDYFKAIVSGYLSGMNARLTEKEKQYIVYAGKFMIYMQALRFLTDHLNNDIYYGAAYPGQNLLRAQNQTTLLNLLCEKEEKLQALVQEALEVSNVAAE